MGGVEVKWFYQLIWRSRDNIYGDRKVKKSYDRRKWRILRERVRPKLPARSGIARENVVKTNTVEKGNPQKNRNAEWAL